MAETDIVMARDVEANNWIAANAPSQIVDQLARWSRGVINECDPDDSANLGTILFDVRELRTAIGEPGIRAYTYGLIFQWEDGQSARAVRAALRTSDSNQIVEFIPVDRD